MGKEKPTNRKQIFIISGALVLVILFGLFGWGFFQGQKVKKFAVDSEKMMASVDGWNEVLEKDEDLSAIRNQLEKVHSDSEKYVATIEKNSVSGGQKKLKSDLLDYFRLTGELSGEAIEILDWSVDVQGATKDSLDISSIISSTSGESVTTSFENSKAKTKITITKLEKIDVPDSVKNYHNSFIAALNQMVIIYDRLIGAIQNNSIDALASISTELSSVQETMENAPMPEKTFEAEYANDIRKLNELESQIQEDIKKYKNTYFTF